MCVTYLQVKEVSPYTSIIGLGQIKCSIIDGNVAIGSSVSAFMKHIRDVN